ncbi:hypothetical protein ASE61_04955 [Bosea sp. Root670]|nr:hypothetical protein ASE61_04955 [Bosea sp. Root670]
MLYSLGDLKLALSAANFLSECEPGEKISKVDLRRFKSYETTLVVAYARPFSASRGTDRIPPLSLKMTGAKLTVEQRALHDRIIELRNKAFAHSDGDMMRMLVRPIEVDGKEEGDTITLVQTVFDEGLEFLGMELLDVIELMNAVYGALYHQVHVEAQQDSRRFDFRHDYLSPE